MCLSNEAAAIKLAERDNLVGELVEALEKYLKAGFGESTDFYLQGEAYDAAIKAIAKAREGAQS